MQPPPEYRADVETWRHDLGEFGGVPLDFAANSAASKAFFFACAAASPANFAADCRASIAAKGVGQSNKGIEQNFK
jgi:hypothetical protein